MEKLEMKHDEDVKRIQKKHDEDKTRTDKNTLNIVKNGESIKTLKDSIELKQDKKEYSEDVQKIKQK